ncbi:N-acetyltransferase B complex non catalytic subunit-domain-containing protein [Xylogone sp. PMI_703]|nr:N-acetyltransferase B complex non catalytic subunit-domain-containing protein [Xylogone sp. PMI_703]
MDKLPSRDRQDGPILQAIDAKNYKQALRLIDKRIAKKRTDYLEALKIYITSEQSSTGDSSPVLTALEKLIQRDPPVLDLDAIAVYEAALENILSGNEDYWARLIGRLRWQCVKASPKDEDSGLKNLRRCLIMNDIEHAQQIANSLDKNFPGNRSYIFWAITISFLYSTSSSCPPKMRDSFGRLSLARIQKLAQATEETKDAKALPARAIQTPQELLLLHKISSVYGKDEDLLKYLQKPSLGPDSTIAKGQWRFWRELVLRMRKSELWEELFQTCSSLLQRARTKDDSGEIIDLQMADWVVWDAFVASALKLTEEHREKIPLEVEAHLAKDSGVDKTYRRNASLALLHYKFELHRDTQSAPVDVLIQSLSISGADDSARESLLTSIMQYIKENNDGPAMFNDVRPYVERFPDSELQDLVKTLLPCESNFRKVHPRLESLGSQEANGNDEVSDSHSLVLNESKLVYLLASSMPEYQRLKNPKFQLKDFNTQEFICKWCSKPCGLYCNFCLETLAHDFSSAYGSILQSAEHITTNLLSTDTHPADDLCLLAAMCLLKCAGCTPYYLTPANKASAIYVSRMLQAALLLEYAWTHSKPDFQISLLLIRIYTHLGCGSLAGTAYKRLGIKQIQHSTLAYTLFDRISSLHPHDFTDTEHTTGDLKDPLHELVKQQSIYESAVTNSRKSSWQALEFGNYEPIIQFSDFAKRMGSSMSGVMSAVEHRKILRITQPKIASNFKLNDLYASNTDEVEFFHDNNDNECFPNFECTPSQPFEVFTRSGPPLSNARTRANLVIEKLRSIFNPNAKTAEKSAAELWFKKTHKDIYIPTVTSDLENMEMTAPELSSASGHNSMAVVVNIANNPDIWSNPDTETKLNQAYDSLIQSIEELAKMVDGIQDPILAFTTTLHPLYVAREYGTAVIDFHKYISSSQKKISEQQKGRNAEMLEKAQLLLKTIADKAAAVGKIMEESGWIDKVLNNVLETEQESNGTPPSSDLVVKALKSVIDEGFMETWAGEVVESWRDSVSGFVYLKTPYKS